MRNDYDDDGLPQCNSCRRVLRTSLDIDAARHCEVCGELTCYECLTAIDAYKPVCPQCVRDAKGSIEFLLHRVEDLMSEIATLQRALVR